MNGQLRAWLLRRAQPFREHFFWATLATLIIAGLTWRTYQLTKRIREEDSGTFVTIKNGGVLSTNEQVSVTNIQYAFSPKELSDKRRLVNRLALEFNDQQFIESIYRCLMAEPGAIDKLEFSCRTGNGYIEFIFPVLLDFDGLFKGQKRHFIEGCALRARFVVAVQAPTENRYNIRGGGVGVVANLPIPTGVANADLLGVDVLSIEPIASDEVAEEFLERTGRMITIQNGWVRANGTTVKLAGCIVLPRRVEVSIPQTVDRFPPIRSTGEAPAWTWKNR